MLEVIVPFAKDKCVLVRTDVDNNVEAVFSPFGYVELVVSLVANHDRWIVAVQPIYYPL